MKKLLLTTAACGLALAATPAFAQVELELGGYFKGYGAFVDQDETTATEVNSFDIIRDTEVHFGGETTLDNGLTVGAHIEALADGADTFGVDESYVYMSGGWGRVNFGAEDGAGYLLQVEAPSADSNIDGLRQYVQPINYTTLAAFSGASPAAATITAGGIDYDMDPTAKNDKFTYLSPIMNGFQAGMSFTPDTSGMAAALAGIGLNDVEDVVDETYEGALRYEGQFNNVGMILGAGYTHGNVEESTVPAVTDDRNVWNVGADFDIGPFGVGVAYVKDNGALEESTTVEDEKTLVVGVDYTTGPFKLGASYMDQNNTFTVRNDDLQRYSGGVTYTYGPGMTFRGSIGYIEHEDSTAATADVDATYVTLGTQINF